MTEHSDRTESPSVEEQARAAHERGILDPGLKEQFERDRIIVRGHPSATPDSDALQRPHYEPPDDDEPARP
jgi:hypothetical protein